MWYYKGMIGSTTVAKLFVGSGMIALLFIALLGMSHVGMNMLSHGEMSRCPFAPNASVCAMNPFDHVAAVQRFLNILPNSLGSFSFLLSLILVVVSFSDELLFSSFSPGFLFYRNRRYVLIPTFLEDAFSNGRINSKAF